MRRWPLPVDRELRGRVLAELIGTGPLEPFMSDPLVEEIDVNSHMSTWVTYSDGRKVDVGQLWDSPAALTAYQKRLARRKAGTGEGRLDTQSPMLTFQADDGSRVVMVLGGRGEHGISTHPRIAIRRFVLRQEGLDGLARRGLFPAELVPRLRAMVQCGFTILVSGPPGAGKTTLLTELLGEVSPRERVITVEKNLLELRLEDDPRHPDAPALFTRSANAEGEGEITTRQLVELTRRLNPDRVVVGELVEDEALDMLDVASMCKRGSLATIHAHTSDVVLQRLAYYVAKSNARLPEFAVWNLIAQTVDFVDPHRSRPQRRRRRRARPPRDLDHRGGRSRRTWRSRGDRGVGDRRHGSADAAGPTLRAASAAPAAGGRRPATVRAGGGVVTGYAAIVGLTLVFACGVFLVATPASPRAGIERRRRSLKALASQLAAGLVAGGVVLVVSGWLLPALDRGRRGGLGDGRLVGSSARCAPRDRTARRARRPGSRACATC